MTTPEQNKELVLKAFDTLFEKRDYATAEELWSEEYVPAIRPHHSRGRAQLRCRCRRSPAPSPSVPQRLPEPRRQRHPQSQGRWCGECVGDRAGVGAAEE